MQHLLYMAVPSHIHTTIQSSALHSAVADFDRLAA
jgi:hypothetical protein